MIKLIDLLSPKTILLEMEEKELPEEFKLTDRGLQYLRDRIAVMNKKAAKYKVPPIDINIIKEEMVKVLRPDIKSQIDNGMLQFDVGVLNEPGGEIYWTMIKQYTVSIKGEPPHIDGYEFIARLEHTPEGNFVYTNPKSSVKNLPAEFKTMNQKCDICNTNRDRNDTFVIKMTQDDPVRFPAKKSGDMLIVGRNCLSRFLPGISISGLIMFTKMIDNLKDDITEATSMEENDGMGGGGGGKYYEDPEHLLKYLVATYLHTGFYLSKKQAQANYDSGNEKNSTSTLSRALSEMRPNMMVKSPKETYPVYFRLKDDTSFIANVENMMKEFEAWLPTKDWDAMAIAKPDFADFFHNLKLVASQDYLRGNHFGFYSALFQLFIRDQKNAEKKEAEKKEIAAFPPSPVIFDATLIKKRLRDVAKESEIKRLAAGGLDEKAIKKQLKGKVWGWEVTCKKIVEYEKTNTFGYGDTGIGYRIFFRDEFGNDFLWFASNNPGFNESGKYIIDGTITRYEAMNQYSKRPQTVINRVTIVKDYQNPEKPPEPPASPEPPHPPVVQP
jgi:hypothetical protein